MVTTGASNLDTLIDSADVDALRAALRASLAQTIHKDLSHNAGDVNGYNCDHYSSYVNWVNYDYQVTAITRALRG